MHRASPIYTLLIRLVPRHLLSQEKASVNRAFGQQTDVHFVPSRPWTAEDVGPYKFDMIFLCRQQRKARLFA